MRSCAGMPRLSATVVTGVWKVLEALETAVELVLLVCTVLTAAPLVGRSPLPAQPNGSTYRKVAPNTRSSELLRGWLTRSRFWVYVD
ncbi:hypothetical protein GCM10010442_68050 [Kitasatospora kifunensis]